MALNPETFSPEMMLSAAAVVQLPDSEAQQVVVRMLTRLCASEAFISFGLAQSEDQATEEEFTWNDILESKWKIIAT